MLLKSCIATLKSCAAKSSTYTSVLSRPWARSTNSKGRRRTLKGCWTASHQCCSCAALQRGLAHLPKKPTTTLRRFMKCVIAPSIVTAWCRKSSPTSNRPKPLTKSCSIARPSSPTQTVSTSIRRSSTSSSTVQSLLMRAAASTSCWASTSRLCARTT